MPPLGALDGSTRVIARTTVGTVGAGGEVGAEGVASSSASPSASSAPVLQVPFAPGSTTTTTTEIGARGNGLSVRVVGALDPALQALAVEVKEATRAIAARVRAGGFEPYALGLAPTGIVQMGACLGVKFTGGSNHPGGSALLVNPQTKEAHHLKHGFFDYACTPQASLGGRPLLDVLGPPLEDEHPGPNGTSEQRFAHGTLVWTPGAGASVQPASLLSSTSKAPVLAALPIVAKDTHAQLLTATWLAPMAYQGEDHSSFFVEWAKKQVEHNPVMKTVHTQLEAVLDLPSSQRPDRLAGLLSLVRSFAHTAVEAMPDAQRLPQETKQHLENVTTLVTMSAVALKNDGSNRVKSFPVFMWDGRTVDAGMDKSWHFTNHAMMAYVLRFEGQHGDGTITKAFTSAVEDADKLGAAQRINKTYHERQGSLGGFVSWVVSGPPDDDTPLYAPPPTGLTKEEQQTFDLAVRIGDAHELKSSGDAIPVGVDDIGDTTRRWDPLAEVHARFSRVWGLQDHGVARDLTANRLGARFALELFRSPSTTPSFPYDEGKVDKNGAYAASRGVPFAAYLAEEHVMLDALHGTPGSQQKYEAQLASTTAEGAGAATKRVRDRLAQTIDALIAKGDVDVLSAFYGNFSVRHQRFGERLQGYKEDGGYYSSSSTGHASWARDRLKEGNGSQVKDGFLSRFDEMVRSFR